MKLLFRVGPSLGLFVAFLSASPSVQAYDGNKLLSSCQVVLGVLDDNKYPKLPSEIMEGGACLGLMQGITQTNLAYSYLKLSDHPLMCLPEGGIKNGQAARIVVKYLKEHPEKLNDEDIVLATWALQAAFPCGSQ